MITVFSPAKINLYLAITGRRADGFHDLVSVAAPLQFGDELAAEPLAAGGFTLECDDPAVPVDGSNLILKAAALFAATTGWEGGARFCLTKRIPMGAGLGGGHTGHWLQPATIRISNAQRMWIIYLEVLVALALAGFIVWFTWPRKPK